MDIRAEGIAVHIGEDMNLAGTSGAAFEEVQQHKAVPTCTPSQAVGEQARGHVGHVGHSFLDFGEV